MKKALLFLTLIIILGIGLKFLSIIYFSGTEKIKILKDYDEITSLNELINHSEFNEKVLYIDFYSTSCSNAIEQFKYFPDLKKDINKKDLIYVHLSAPTNIYDWKSTIKKYQLEDYNILMNEEFYKEFWTNFPDRIKAPPFYLLIDKEKIVTQPLDPKSFKSKKYVDHLFKRISNYVNNNLTTINQKLISKPEKLNISVKINEASEIEDIKYSIIKKDKEIKQKLEMWKDMDKLIKSINDTILDNINIGKYSITIPLIKDSDEKYSG